MANAWASQPVYNLSRQSLGQENKGISRRANPDPNGQSGGARQPGREGSRVFLIKPNQIKPVPFLRPARVGELRSVRSGGLRCLGLAGSGYYNTVD